MLAIALLLMGQWFVPAHAIEFGTEPHEHNGVVCFTVLQSEDEHLLPSKPPVALSLVLDDAKLLYRPTQVPFTKNVSTKPPSTGPPLI